MFEHIKGRQGYLGKIVDVVGIREIYQDYKQRKKSEGLKVKDIIPYKTHKNIIFDCNKEISRIQLEEADEFRLPFGLGVLGIYKIKRKFKDDKPNKWPLDWKASREAKTKRLHMDLFSYKFKWTKKGRGVDNYKLYKFLATRTNTRQVNHNKKKGIDWFYYNDNWNGY